MGSLLSVVLAGHYEVVSLGKGQTSWHAEAPKETGELSPLGVVFT